MSYQDQAHLAQDNMFAQRLEAALVKESVPKVDDFLADTVLRGPTAGAQMFMPLVASAPGFDGMYATGGQTAISDLDILSAIQANWARVADLWQPAPIPPG